MRGRLALDGLGREVNQLWTEQISDQIIQSGVTSRNGGRSLIQKTESSHMILQDSLRSLPGAVEGSFLFWISRCPLRIPQFFSLRLILCPPNETAEEGPRTSERSAEAVPTAPGTDRMTPQVGKLWLDNYTQFDHANIQLANRLSKR